MGHFTAVVPIPRYDIAEADEPLVAELLSRGHEVRVVTRSALEARYGFGARGCRVWLDDSDDHDSFEERPKHLFGVARTTFVDTLRLYRLAVDVIDPGAYVIAHSNDAVFIKPFVEAARARGATVAFVQMAYFHADVAGHYHRIQSRKWGRVSLAKRIFLQLQAGCIRALTNVRVYVGPRRVWGANASVCFMADEVQARNHIAAGVPSERFRVTGVPFMDMMWRQRREFDETARRDARCALHLNPAKRLLLVVTQDIDWILPGSAGNRVTFIRDLMRTTAAAVPDWDVVFKLHPVELVDDYARARDQAGCDVAIVRDFNIVTALLASDAMVSVDISSPCYYARALAVPQVIFRVAGSTLNDPHVPNFSGVPIVDSSIELDRALRAIAAAQPGRNPPAEQADLFDGNGSVRIVDELERLDASTGVMFREDGCGVSQLHVPQTRNRAQY